MKAKEIIAKYKDDLRKAIDERDQNTVTQLATQVFGEYTRELKSLIESRGVKTDKGTIAIIKELDQKWHSMISGFEKEGLVWLKPDAWRIFIKDKIPEISKETNW